jgi:hypothetical protein
VKLTVYFITLILFIVAIDCFAQTDTLRVPVDTIYFSGYTAINYKVYEDENWWDHEVEIRLCDKVLLTSIKWFPSPALYNLSYGTKGDNGICYLRDINNDHKPEIIINVVGGGNNGWESNFIYTLDTAATLIGNFDGNNTGLNALRMEDIDGDSIPELIFNDMNYGCWPEGCFGAPAPLLIWKWTGSKYKLSNIKFKTYLLKQDYWCQGGNSTQAVNAWVSDFYKRSGYGEFPPVIADVMLEYIYMGENEEADSAFYSLWPEAVENKERYHKEIWDYAKNSPFWNELRNSDW